VLGRLARLVRCPIFVPDLPELAMLADVRELIDKHLPKEYRAKFTWRQRAGLLKRAAHRGDQDRIAARTAAACKLCT
jgi:hypothetical protein